MKNRRVFFVLLAALALIAQSGEARAETSVESSSVEDAIRRQAKSYETAFANSDAKTIASLWAADGTYVDDKGREFSGRAQIEALFQGFFKQSPSKTIAISIDSIKPIGETAAIEKGSAAIKDGKGQILSTAPYTAVHVKNGDKWEMASVTDYPARIAQDQLPRLSWLAGEWTAKGPDGDANVSTKWVGDNHFLVAKFQVVTKGGDKHEDTQVIGTDPVTKGIVSWIFDSQGGTGRAMWTNDGNRWIVDTVRTSADGRRVWGRNVLEPAGDDSFRWQSISRTVDGTILPDSDKLTVNRVRTQ